jgi:ribonuclease VapC
VSAEVPAYVLDSFALLAYLQNETSAAQVSEIMGRAQMSEAELRLCIVNYGEAIYIIEREYGLTDAQNAIAAIDQLPITVVDAGRELTFAAAHIKAHYALSYADAFAIALAQRGQAVLVTGDPEFRKVESLVKVKWLKPG